MAERIVSPGVFTRERDLSYLPQGIASIGAAMIGPTLKGPAMEPIQIQSFNDFVSVFGNTNPNLYLPYAAKEYLKHGDTLTIVRTLHTSGYQLNDGMIKLTATYDGVPYTIALLHPSQLLANKDYAGTSPIFTNIAISGTGDEFDIECNWGTIPTYAISDISLDSTSNNYIGKVLSRNANTTKHPIYLYRLYEQNIQYLYGELTSASAGYDDVTVAGTLISNIEFDQYSSAITPWIISQTISGLNQRLFRCITISDGTTSNYETKIAISNIRPAGTIPGSEYGTFTLQVRAVDQSKFKVIGTPYDTIDSDLRPTILESFDGLTLDPNSPRYITRVIGDRFSSYNNDGKLILNGEYPNKSKYIYIEIDDNVKNGINSPDLIPFGFEALKTIEPLSGDVEKATYVDNQMLNGIYNKRVYFGFDYSYDSNLYNYLTPLSTTAAYNTVANNGAFLLSDCTDNSIVAAPPVSLTTSIDSRKFIIPFQGGFDGINPNHIKAAGEYIGAGNTCGYNLSAATTDDYNVYKQAIDIFSNPDEIDINLLTMPGVFSELHPAVIDYANNMCLDRSDVFFVFDTTGLTGSKQDAISAVETMDTNYAATYYPWVKILDVNINKPVLVPPSIVIPGVLAYNDKVSAEWYAPAGLNRGGLDNVLEAYTRLSQSERDELYENRINPIATFPSHGVVVWGQKTLQIKPSALDRINVRRSLIAIKKYIASVTKYLVFENNTAVTRNRFLNTVNPYLESIQQRQGLYAFKIVMDESNNTADIIDRNMLVGNIFLQPTKTAEFILIDFTIQPTGASFTN